MDCQASFKSLSLLLGRRTQLHEPKAIHIFTDGLDERHPPTKNSNAFKLKGLPPILWLNLNADTRRRKYMEEQFEYWEVTHHTRICGFDGRDDDLSQYIEGNAPDHREPMTPGE